MTDFSELKNADIATIVLHPNIANRKEAGETKSLNERPVASLSLIHI